MTRHKVAKVADMKPGDAHLIEIEGKRIALFRTGTGFHAIDAVCPHRGGPLVEGAVEDDRVTCPWHAWTFDLVSGTCETGTGFKQQVYPVRVENGDVLIELF